MNTLKEKKKKKKGVKIELWVLYLSCEEKYFKINNISKKKKDLSGS